MRYKVVCKYVGTAYYGWQKQVNQISVQAVIEEKLSTIFNTPVTIQGSGRTDRGVHAFGQTFHFDAKKIKVKQLKYALNKMLPGDIEIVDIKIVPETFHARHSAKGKVYEYIVVNKYKDPFNENKVLFYPGDINLPLLKEAINSYVGEHSFQNFCSKEEDENNFIRQVYTANVRKNKDKYIFCFSGNGFMHGQIRMMVGALLAINEGKVDGSFIVRKLQEKERNIIHYKVSGSGLYLVKVNY